MNELIDQEFKKEVLEEIQDHIQGLVDTLEAGELKELCQDSSLSSLFRVVHSIKGVSRAGDFEKLSEVTHLFENLLFDIKSGKRPCSEQVKSLFVNYCDEVGGKVEQALKSNLSSDMETFSIKAELENFFSNEEEGQTQEKKKKIRILAIDDEEGVLDILQEFLVSEFDAEVVLCLDGEEGRQEANKEKFNVIFSDYQMPRLNGFQFLEDLRDHAESPNYDTPVLILTGMKPMIPQSVRVREKTYFLEKPFNFKELEFYTKVAIKEGLS